MLRLMIPYCLYLLTFVLYTNFLYFDRDNNPWTQLLYTIIIVGLSIYFLFNEFVQLKDDIGGYFLSVWNYIDILPPVLALSCMAVEHFTLFDNLDDSMQYFHSFTTFVSWLKLLYFMRIFKNTGHLIRIIVDVIYDMRHFLLVLFITILAYSDALSSLSYPN